MRPRSVVKRTAPKLSMPLQKFVKLCEWPFSLWECGQFGEIGEGMSNKIKEKLHEAYQIGIEEGKLRTRTFHPRSGVHR